MESLWIMIINLSLKDNYLYLWLLAKEYVVSVNNQNAVIPPLELLTEVAQFYCARPVKIKMEQVFLLPTENGSIVTAASETTEFKPWDVTVVRISFQDFLEKTEGQFRKNFPHKKYPHLYISNALSICGALRKIAEEIIRNKGYYPQVLVRGKSIVPQWYPFCDRATRFCLEEIAQSLPLVFFQDYDFKKPPLEKAYFKKPLAAVVDLLTQHITKSLTLPKDLQNHIVHAALPQAQKRVLNSFLKKQEPVKLNDLQEIETLSAQFKAFQNATGRSTHNPFVLMVALKVSITNSLCYQFDILNQATNERCPLSKEAINQGIPKDTLILLMKTVRQLFPDRIYPWEEEIVVETRDIFNHIEDLHAKSRTHLFYLELPEGLKSRAFQKPRAIAHIKSKDIGGSFLSTDSIAQVEWKMLLGDQEVDIATLDRLVAENQTTYMSNQSMMAINPADIKAFLKELKDIQKKDLTPLELLRQSSLLQSCEFKLDTGWIKQVMEQLNSHTPTKDLDPPGNIHGQLRPYQIRGFSWLVFMQNLGLGSCLADDMGLGKTLQTLVFLQYQKNIAKLTKPALIVCSTSLMSNWKHEMDRFSPGLTHEIYHGSERSLDASSKGNKDVLITSYGIVERDKDILKKVSWSVVILDEAQNIKNPEAKQTRAVKHLKGDYRIALTGTPVENSSQDLWSIMDFINPGLLGSHTWFNDYFSAILKRGEASGLDSVSVNAANTNTNTIANNPNTSAFNTANLTNPTNTTTTPSTVTYSTSVSALTAIPTMSTGMISSSGRDNSSSSTNGDDLAKSRGQKLRNMVSPFILRRLKSDKLIIADLPEKLEFKTYCSLTLEQVALYKATVDDMINRISKLDSRFAKRNLVLVTITRLKQICNHPLLILKNDKRGVQGRSGKLDRLMELVEEIQRNQEKVLIFSQFKQMGELLVEALEQRFGNKPLFLNGSVPAHHRTKLIESFQGSDLNSNSSSSSNFNPNPNLNTNFNDTRNIFVLSLKAGGTGLNLTAANHVIHYDRWWNPAVENQATDRAYRIGQDKIVQVHKFICAGTIEDRIDQMIDNKKALSNSLVGDGEGWITELSDKDLKALFTLDEAA